MALTRRSFLTAAGLGVAALGSVASCTSPITANPGKLTLWYTNGGLADPVVADAQHAQSAIPDELLEAARMDGCGFFRTYLTIGLRPALAFLGIFTFVNAWNDYLWPLVVLIDSNHVTLQVALSQLNSLYVKDYSVVMAGTLVAIVPLIVVFLFGARHFIRNIAAGALKG